MLGVLLELGCWNLVFSSLFIHDSNDHPANGTFIVPYGFAGRGSIRGKNNTLVHSSAVSIYGNLRNAFRIASKVNGLTNHQAPPLETCMFASRRKIAFHPS